MYVKTIQCLNYSGQESKKQFVVYDSDTPVTLKQGQRNQTWYKLVDPKQGYYNAKFEEPRLNSVHERAHDRIWSKKQWYIHDRLNVLNNPTKF